MTEPMQILFDLFILIIAVSALFQARGLRREYERHRDADFIHHTHGPNR